MMTESLKRSEIATLFYLGDISCTVFYSLEKQWTRQKEDLLDVNRTTDSGQWNRMATSEMIYNIVAILDCESWRYSVDRYSEQ